MVIPSSDVCPSADPASPSPQPADGRVHGGRLSYPTLGATRGTRRRPSSAVAFGRGVLRQYEEVEPGDFGHFSSWGAAVLVGELVAGDGFFTPRDGAAIVVKCVTGTFYGDTEVTREDQNTAIKVDGHDAWIIESNLGFDVPGLQAKHELLIVVIVDTRDGSAGLFFASVPENAPQLVGPARQALASLRVD